MAYQLAQEDFTDSMVLCLSFNFYGDRLAVSTADQMIQVLNLEDSGWKFSSKFSGHHGAIFKVRWGHPEFGTLLASCSFDKSVNLYEENSEDKSWALLASLRESKEPVEDIQFCPHHQGLKLAACSSNGEIRIYEPSSSVNLKVWGISHTIIASPLGSNVIAWDQSILRTQSILVGNNDVDTASAKFCRSFRGDAELIQLWRYDEEIKSWHKKYIPHGHDTTVVDLSWPPLMGRSKHIACSASIDGKIIVWRIDVNDGSMEKEHEISENFRVCASLDILGSTLSVCFEGSIKVWKKDTQHKWVYKGILS